MNSFNIETKKRVSNVTSTVQHHIGEVLIKAVQKPHTFVSLVKEKLILVLFKNDMAIYLENTS